MAEHDPETCPCNVHSALRARRRANAAAVHQPAPETNDLKAVQDLVIEDIEARKLVGLERYGTLLQPFNGRDALMDAYQEALDLAVYLRQTIEERDERARRLAAGR